LRGQRFQPSSEEDFSQFFLSGWCAAQKARMSTCISVCRLLGIRDARSTLVSGVEFASQKWFWKVVKPLLVRDSSILGT